MTAAGPIRRVQLTPAAWVTIHHECARSRDGNETGGILLGHVRGTIAEVRIAGTSGPAAVRQPGFFLRDLDHAQRLAHHAFTRDGSIWIGEWHTHLATPPAPSGRDLDTYARLLADPDLGFDAIVAIIVAGAPDWRTPVACAWISYADRAEVVPLTIDMTERRHLPLTADNR